MNDIKTVPFTSTGGEPIRMLPVCGIASGMARYLVPTIDHHFGMLNANSIDFGVTEQDYLYNPAGVATSVAMLADNFNVYVSPWGVGGVFGGESLTGGHISRSRGKKFAMTHSVFAFGPRAQATPVGQEINRSVLPFLRWLIDVGADNGAVGLLLDEPKIAGPGRFGDWAIDPDDIREAVAYARSRGLATMFVMAYVGGDDLELMRWIAAEGLADSLGFTRYHAVGTYDDVPPEQYLGEAYDQLLALPVREGHAMAYLATVQGFDLGSRADVIIRNADIARSCGIDNLLIWGGTFVDEQMDLVTGAELPTPARYYPEIGKAFDCGNNRSVLLERMRIEAILGQDRIFDEFRADGIHGMRV